MLQIAKQQGGKDVTYDQQIVPLLAPVMSCYFVESEKADAFYAKTKLYDVSIDYYDCNIRRELLIDQVAEHKVKLFEGPIPSSIVFGFLSPTVFDGDYAKSTFKFGDHGLDQVDLQIDNQSLNGYPITMKSGNAVSFYLDYLKQTNRYENVFATGALSYANFEKYNFLVFSDLKSEGATSGQLLLKLKFSSLLSEKLLLIYMPVYEKHITFDQYMNVTVSN